jgi:hypothetical protein
MRQKITWQVEQKDKKGNWHFLSKASTQYCGNKMIEGMQKESPKGEFRCVSYTD